MRSAGDGEFLSALFPSFSYLPVAAVAALGGARSWRGSQASTARLMTAHLLQLGPKSRKTANILPVGYMVYNPLVSGYFVFHRVAVPGFGVGPRAGPSAGRQSALGCGHCGHRGHRDAAQVRGHLMAAITFDKVSPGSPLGAPRPPRRGGDAPAPPGGGRQPPSPSRQLASEHGFITLLLCAVAWQCVAVSGRSRGAARGLASRAAAPPAAPCSCRVAQRQKRGWRGRAAAQRHLWGIKWRGGAAGKHGRVADHRDYSAKFARRALAGSAGLGRLGRTPLG